MTDSAACVHDDLAVVDECPTCIHCGVIVPCEGCGKRPADEPMYLIHASDDRLKAWLCEECEGGWTMTDSTPTTAAPCAHRGIAGDLVTDACPDCGHTWLVHPISGNPAVGSCVLCRLEALIRG